MGRKKLAKKFTYPGKELLDQVSDYGDERLRHDALVLSRAAQKRYQAKRRAKKWGEP